MGQMTPAARSSTASHYGPYTSLLTRIRPRRQIYRIQINTAPVRHGWGTTIDRERAMTYLSLAASNAAGIQSAALAAAAAASSNTTTPASTITSTLTSPLRRPTTGPAHDELSQAMFELGNNFRHGWGVAVDAVAARTYYEVAAHMGDADAMHEIAWCYLHGFGGAKDKARAAMFLRKAEGRAGKVYGNGW